MSNTNNYFSPISYDFQKQLPQSIKILNDDTLKIMRSSLESFTKAISIMFSQINDDFIKAIQSTSIAISDMLQQSLDIPLNNFKTIMKDIVKISECTEMLCQQHDCKDELSKCLEVRVEIVTMSQSLTNPKNSYDWKFWLPFIVSLLSLLLQISSNIDSERISSSDLKVKAEISDTLHELKNHIEEQSKNTTSTVEPLTP